MKASKKQVLKLNRELLEEIEKSHRKPKKSKKKPESLIGIFSSTEKGFGFVTVEGYDEDFFISHNNVNGAFTKDTVRIQPKLHSHGKRKEAVVEEIIMRGITSVVGVFDKQAGKNYGFVIPDDGKLPFDIFVPIEKAGKAVDGHKVIVEIEEYGEDGKSPTGKIMEILGHENDPGVDILSIAKAYDMPIEFPDRVLEQANHVSTPVTQSDIDFRRDLREELMITIDGEDAKDLDDAVSMTFDGTYYHLGVHIADVTNYVQESSALDREALKRGTSVYLVDRVIPMLPHVLSNGICSLNEGEDRLALSCLMTIDSKGEIIDHEICESVIRVNHRMSYTQVKLMVSQGEEGDNKVLADSLRERYCDIFPMLQEMVTCAAILRHKRMERGSIDFDFPECKIVLDKNGKPQKIEPYDRNVATKLIEDFMLAANETIAAHFFWLDSPFVYRVHGVPEGEKLIKLRTLLKNMGYYLKSADQNAHPKEFQKLLEKIDGKPEEAMISRLVLRSMKQAKYSVINNGHFGLACEHYCHFTSPIRRYPDLQIHRIIKDHLRGNLNERKIRHYNEILPKVAEDSSSLERRAADAERETEKLKKVEYMSRYIGEEFEGVISSVTGWGLYVELPNTVEGLVRVTNMIDDYYRFDEETYELIGDATGKVYKLGMKVRVVLDDCDIYRKTIDFHLGGNVE